MFDKEKELEIDNKKTHALLLFFIVDFVLLFFFIALSRIKKQNNNNNKKSSGLFCLMIILFSTTHRINVQSQVIALIENKKSKENKKKTQAFVKDL